MEQITKSVNILNQKSMDYPEDAGFDEDEHDFSK